MLAKLLAAPADDDWLSQRESPLPARVHCRLGRDLGVRGDPRARRRGKLTFIRRSALDEYMRGLPQPAGGDAAPAHALTSVEKCEQRLRARGLIR
jgi:hypothetical protein